MKILLLGECSNMHWMLAQALRQSGHDVTVASDGSKWMENNRDLDLTRNGYSFKDSLRYMWHLFRNLDKLKGYDIVQIKNPLFIDMKADRNLWLYKYLKRNNGKVFLGAFGTDYYWVSACFDRKTFRYSDYFIGNEPNNIEMAVQLAKEWQSKEKRQLNEYIADTCDGIIACLYEYYAAYKPLFDGKLTYISEPVNTQELTFIEKSAVDDKIRFFVGVQSDRHELKGTDLLMKCLKEIHRKYPREVLINKAENVPNKEYLKLMAQSDVLLDQVYSYTPGMNALTAMAQGLVTVSGAEPEMYTLLGESLNMPIVNVHPDEQDIFDKLEKIVLQKERLPEQSTASRKFIEKHHDSFMISRQYLDFWNK